MRPVEAAFSLPLARSAELPETVCPVEGELSLVSPGNDASLELIDAVEDTGCIDFVVS